jgi:predicted short-subunit dehydrogenase-like oxidoreductase (DUF2520 family)
MYVTNFKHLLNNAGKIPKDMPVEARELANFLALIVDDATSSSEMEGQTGVKCNLKACSGVIVFSDDLQGKILWYCNTCPNEGIISNWQNTHWDNG